MLVTRHQAIFSGYENSFALGLSYLKETFYMPKKKKSSLYLLSGTVQCRTKGLPWKSFWQNLRGLWKALLSLWAGLRFQTFAVDQSMPVLRCSED